MTLPHQSSDDAGQQDDPQVAARLFLARLSLIALPTGDAPLADRARHLFEELVEVAEQLVAAESTGARSTSKRKPGAASNASTVRFRKSGEEESSEPAPSRFKRKGSMPSAASLMRTPPPVALANNVVAPKPATKPPATKPVVTPPVVAAPPIVDIPKVIVPPLTVSPAPSTELQTPIEPPKVVKAPIAEASLLPLPTPAPKLVLPKRSFASKKSAGPAIPAVPKPVAKKPAAPARESKSWRRPDEPVPSKSNRTPFTSNMHAGSHAPDRSEIGIPIRWWNAPVFLALSLFIAAILGGVGFETLRVSVPQASLTRVLRQSDSTPDEVRQAAQQLVSSPLTRYDAARELLMAEATRRVNEGDAETRQANVVRHLERATAKEPLSPWHRLNFALTAKSASKQPEDIASIWASLEKNPSAEPLIQEQVAFHQIDQGETAAATKQLKNLLTSDPTRTDSVVAQLLAKRFSLDDSLAVIPDSPVSLACLLNLAERETVIGLRRQIEVRLTQIDPHATNSLAQSWKPVDWAALGAVYQGFQRWDEAAEAWERAVAAEPSKREWKFPLAKVRFEQKRYEECEDAIAELLVSKLPPDLLDEVRTLQDQVTDALATDAVPSGVPPSPPTMRAN